MKVSHFNTFPYGGAATAATRLHSQLRQLGIESEFCFHRNERQVVTDSTFRRIEFAPPQFGPLRGPLKRRQHRRRQKEIYRQFNEHLATRPPEVETFSMADLPNPTGLDWAQFNSDIVHLHWISFFADYSSFFQSIPRHVPVVWTLHDMNSFTGGCHYSNGCEQFRFGCGDCPQVIRPGHQDVSRHGFDSKKKALAGRDVHVVSPSEWLLELARKSDIWPERTTFRMNRLGFDLQQFQPLPKQTARETLGINSQAVLIGFGAEDLQNRRKGMQHLLSALRRLSANSSHTNPVECLVFGSGEIAETEGLPRIHQMGYLDSETLQTNFYSAADFVVVPSREDNQPQVGLEAMACGTPVIGFETGGIPEYVREGETGLLARLGDENHLADRIGFLAADRNERIRMGKKARIMMEQKFELQTQTQSYVELYENAVRQRHKQAA